MIKMMTKTEKDKLEFIDAVNTEINELVEPILEKRMNTYCKQFGGMSRLDVRLWFDCNIGFVVAYQASIAMDAEVD